MKDTLKYLKHMKKRIALCVFSKSSAAVMELLLPLLLATMIDDIAPNQNIPMVVIFGILMIICTTISIWGNLTCNRTTAKISRDVVEELRNDVYTKVFDLNISQLDRITISSSISRLTTDIQNIYQLVGTFLRMGTRSIILFIVGLIFAMAMDIRLSIVMFAMLPFVGISAFYTTSKGVKLNRKIQVANDELVNVTRDAVSGMMEIKGFNTEEKEAKRFEKVNENLRTKEMTTAKIMSMLNPMFNLILNLAMVSVVLYGASLVQDSLTTSGQIIAFLSYLSIIAGALLAVNRLFLMTSRGMASSARIQEILNLPEEKPTVTDKYGEHEDDYLVFKNVYFKYATNNKPVLNNISFNLKKGETLGIIGSTGSGKTSIINVMQRFYKPKSGEIFINNVNTSAVSEKEIHQKFGVVMQNDTVFSDTIAGNIALGRVVSEEQMWKALEIADLKSFVETKEEKLDFKIVGNGGNLSGGQRQRLLIARAIALAPEILILDDSSSALDYSTDAKIRKSIANHLDCTTIIIAQRITSLMSCSKVLFINEKGEQIGLGSHRELMLTCPEYLEMWNIQTGGAKFE
ncbi:MAG: ABC transporter ATP-binding protein [Clostridia bacterium]